MGRSASWICADIVGLSLSVLIAFGLAPVCISAQGHAQSSDTFVKPYVDPDAYSIYAILLESAGHSFIVIQSETEFWPEATPENVGVNGDSKFHRVWGPALKDYVKQYQSPRLLSRNFPTNLTYELVPKRKLDDILESGKRWDRFYELYPSSGGYYWFSAVGMDASRRHAIVSMIFQCKGLCSSGGTTHFFQKTNGKWREVSVRAEVSVLAS